MQVSSTMEDSFALLAAGWTAALARGFLAGLAFSHVIIQRSDGDRWYLFRRAYALDVLKRAGDDQTLSDAFNLHEYTATQSADASADAETAPDQLVVTSEGRAIGFLDFAPTMPPAMSHTGTSTYSGDSIHLDFPSLDGGGNTRRRSAHRQAGASAGKRSFSAYPALSMPVAVAAETPFEITAGFRDTPDAALTGSGKIQIDHPTDKDCLIVLTADGITLDREHDTVPLRPNALVRFTGRLKAGLTDASVKALYFLGGQLIGSAKRQVVLSGQPEPAPDATPPFRIAQPLPQSGIDFWVSITLLNDGTLVWRLAAPGVAEATAKRKFTSALPDTRQFAADLMSDLKSQSHRGVAARAILENTGREIADLIPKEFFDILAQVHQSLGRAPTLLLLTDENYVPWELAFVDRPLDPDAPPFLAAQVQMGRWLENERVMLPPAAVLEVRRISAVAAKYGLGSSFGELKEALAEQKALVDAWEAIPLKAVKEDIIPIISGVQIPGHLVHFAVHGYADPTLNTQRLLLEDGTQYPAAAFTGGYKPGGTPRFTFMFLNACQVGAPGRTLGHAGGFPPTLIRAGTLGFIAPLWDVDDVVARELAEGFYANAFQRDEPVGALMQAQRRTYTDGSTTPMAYIYYGHPGLRLKFVSPKGLNDDNPDTA